MTKRSKGQSTLELGIAIPIFLTVILGAYDVGRLFHSRIVITNSAREGARYLSVHPTDKADGYVGTENAVLQEAQNSGFALSSENFAVTLCIDNDAPIGCDPETPVEVTVAYEFNFILVGFFADPLELDSSVRMLVP